MQKRIISIATLVASVLLFAGTASAATATTLTVANVNGTYGGTVNLTATLTQSVGGAPISGKTIIFTLNNIPVGTAVTQVGTGVATLNNIPTLTTSAGLHTNFVKALYLGGGGFAGDNGSANLTLAQKVLTITGISAANKPYDGTTFAVINTTNAHRSGVVLLDTVTIDTTNATGTFDTATAGAGKTVNITGITLGGSSAANYTLGTPQATATATITPIAQTFSFNSLSDQVFGSPDFTVSATSNSTGASTFAGFGACTINGNLVHLGAIGVCTIAASNPGDVNYNAAGPILQSFNVTIPEATDAIYDALPTSYTPSVVSEGFECCSISEFGDYVHFAGTNRLLKTVTVTMSDWAIYSDYATDERYSGNSVTWTHPITINIYSNHLGANGVPDTLLATKTVDTTIPWRPATDATCTGDDAGKWKDSSGVCHGGVAFNATFDLSDLNVILPNDAIVTVAYNTADYGASPIHENGPYNSLNVGVASGQVPSVGTDDSATTVLLNSTWAGAYQTAGTTGILRQDAGWSPNGTVNLEVTASPVTTSSNTVVVKSEDLATSVANAIANPSKWFFVNDKAPGFDLDNTQGSFVTGPAAQPLGVGSAQISATSTQGIILDTLGYQGTSLSKIKSLSYSTYRSVGDPALALALQFDINSNGTTTPAPYQGRLVYEPYYTHTVSDNTWQTWNPMDNSTSGGNGNWWFSKAALATASGCTQATPCTWAQVLAHFPNIGITGSTDFKAGSNWSSPFTGNVDAFSIGIQTGANINTTTYDFEPSFGNLVINSYACPTGTTVVRSANGVGLTIPTGCVPKAGTTFGYVHGTQTDANAPYPELSVSPFTVAGATDGSGVLTAANLPATGRYLVAETDGSGNQLPAASVLGLYCIGDGDTSNNNDNQELTFVPANADVHCVSYDTFPLPAPTPVSPADGVVTTTTAQQLIDWTDVSDAFTPTIYFYQVSNSSATNPDGSFVTPLGSIYPTGTASQIATPSTPEGTYYWHVYAQDNVGNKSPWSITQKIVIDNTAPTATFTFPTPGVAATSFTVTFSEDVNATEATNPANYILNNWPGATSFNDVNGLTGNATVAYDAPSKVATVTFTNPAWYVSPEQQWGVRDIHDLAGNLLNPNPTLAYSSPLVAPGAPGTPTTATPTTSTTQDWTWTASTDPTDSTNASGVTSYEYEVTGDTTISWTNVGNVLGVTTNLPVGSYTLHVRAIDNAGNTGAESTGDLTVTSPVAPATPSVTTNDADGLTTNGATLHGTNGPVAADNTSFWYGTSAAGPFAATADPSTEFPSGWTHDSGLGGAAVAGQFSENLTGLTSGTTYHFAAWSLVGGVWYPGSVLDFTTGVTTEAAPVISNEHITTTSTTATITWTTDHVATSRVVYDTTSHTGGTTPNYGYAFSTSETDTPAGTNGVISHSVTVTGLTPGTTYFFRPVSEGSPEATGDELSAPTSDAPATPSAITLAPSAQSSTDATLNGQNGGVDADQESFWVSPATFTVTDANIPANVYSTPVLAGVSANATFSDPLSLVTTNGIITGGGPGNMPAITPSTTYYYVAWIHDPVTDAWYHGEVTPVTTTATPPALPQAVALNVTTTNDAPVSFTLTGTGGDGPLTFIQDSSPTIGAISGTLPNLTYTPASFHFGDGPDTFTFKVTDGDNTSADATVTITNTDTLPPTITLAGANPATITAGTTYVDPGVTVTDNSTDGNLGYSWSVDGGATSTDGESAIAVDTTSAGTHTIFISAQDSAGNTSTASRVVNVTAPETPTPPTPPAPSGGGGGGGGGNGPIVGSFSSFIGSVLGASTTTVPQNTVTPTTPISCSALLSSYMAYGKKNDSTQVTRLQQFLKDHGYTINVNGFFDLTTRAAVKVFQTDHKTDVLTPWGITLPTGLVFKTTLYEINKVDCPTLMSPFPKLF